MNPSALIALTSLAFSPLVARRLTQIWLQEGLVRNLVLQNMEALSGTSTDLAIARTGFIVNARTTKLIDRNMRSASISEQFGELRARAIQTCLNGLFADAEYLGSLGLREILDRSQDKGFLEIGRQAGDRAHCRLQLL